MDDDGGVTGTKWAWRMADAATGTPPTCPENTDFADSDAVISGAKSDTYEPKSADIDKCLQVTAMYTDEDGSDKTTPGMAANPVVVNQENRAPEFKLNDTVITATTRMVAENTDAISADDNADDETGDNIGPVVMATDMSGTANDTLTYTLGGRDAALFRVRSDTGQIEVGADTELDYEKKKSYMVMVTATDPSLLSATIDVTINVTDVNEPPDIAGEDDLTKEFREDSTSTIETFRATDPERRTVYWSLTPPDTLPDGVDADDHEDNDNFNINKDGQLRFDPPPNFESPKGGGTSDDSNTYKVVVFASDDAPGVGTPTMVSARKFTVKVTNDVEQEKITVSATSPAESDFAQVDATLRASLTPGDATTTDLATADWKWSGAVDGTQDDSATAAITAPSTPGTINIEVTYPALGKDRTKTSSISVKAAPDLNTGPSFLNNSAARDVDEDRPIGTLVGTFLATDGNQEHKNRLTYTLTEDTNFTINNNGQLKTKVDLDHETAPTLTVTVIATDPSNEAGRVTVTVTVNDVNEAPTIATGPTKAPDWLEDKEIDQTVAVYTSATEPDGDDLVWSLTGPDASDFNIGNQTNGTPGTLTFKEMPDYEMPAASNNLYRVTVEVSDGKLKATRPMTVMVTDVEEDGMVTLSSVQPKVAIELTASLKDSDDGVENVTWQWERDGKATSSSTCSAVVAEEWAEIDGAESDAYTPVTSPITDVDKCLRAVAKYTDRRGDGKTSTMGVSGNPVIINTDNRAPEFKDQPSSLKIAEDSDAGTVVGNIQATDPNDDTLTYRLTGDAALFKITSEDDLETTTGDNPDERGQITVKTDDTLNYEAKSSYMVTVTATDPNRLSASHDVTIMVTDMDEAPEIKVGGLAISAGPTNIDHTEDSAADVGTYTVVGSMKDSASWTLNGNDASHFMVQPATGMSVTLMFKSTPDYEMPMDADMDNVYEVSVEATDSESKTAMRAVTITVTNEEEMGEVTLWAGTDALTMAPQVGDTITGAVMDPDGGVMVESWQWSRTMTPDMMDSWMPITGATDAAYMVMESDNGYYLRATATYTDASGTDMAMEYSMPTMMVTMNAAPMFDSETGTREVAENTAAGEPVGAPVTAMDADAGDTLTYTLGGTDMASFAIDGATGQITVAVGTTLDSDTKATYTVTVTATDRDGLSDTITVTITVTAGLPGDTNNDGMIDKVEVIRAFRAYVADPSDKTGMIAIFRQYVADSAAGSQ